MLTDKQARDVRSRFRIFQPRMYRNTCLPGALPDAIESGIGQCIATWHEQGSAWVYNTLEHMNAVAEALKKNLHFLTVAAANVASYD